MRILYVIGKSQYDSTAVFMIQMADRMIECGWQVTILDGRNEKEYATQREIVTGEKYDVIFTINGMLLEQNSSLGKLLLQNGEVLYCTYLMDHPMIHYDRLMNQYPNTFVLSPDRSHVQFMDRYMKNIYAEAFLPHGGCEGRNCIPYSERKYDVTFMGSYSDPVENDKNFDNYPSQMADLMRDMVRRLLKKPDMVIEDALFQSLETAGVLLREEEFAQILSEFREVDRYVRTYFRDQVIRVLVENGIAVDVFGDGWDRFKTDHKEYLKVHSAVKYDESLTVVGNSRISLNIMPWFKDGSHDRVFSAMMCGAVCLTDGSGYLMEELREEENVFFYSLRGLKYLPAKVRRILQDPVKGAEIAENGRRLALQRHTWASRAEEVMEYLQQILDNDGYQEKEKDDTFRKEIIIPQKELIREIDKIISQLHRQEYLYAMRGMNGILDEISNLLPAYKKWEESVPDQRVLLAILQSLVDAQAQKDYVLLADVLQFRLVKFFTQIQEEYMLHNPITEKLREGYRIEYTSSGENTMAAASSEGWVYLHSNGDPYQEASELSSVWFDREHFEYVVFGLGLGYHIQALLDIDEAITVTVLEPDEYVIQMAHRYGLADRNEWAERVQIIWDADFQALTKISASLRDTQQVVVYYPSLCVVKNEYYKQQLEEYFIEYSSAKTQEIRLIGNFVKNQDLFGHEVTELAEKFYGRTVYIIAAGPSLDKNMMELKQVKENDIILSTGTVFKKLLGAGIIPDYVIITDGGSFTYSQTANLTENKVPLLYLSTVYHKILQEYPGETYLICQEGFQKSEQYASQMQYPVYDTGGSVTTTALEIAIRLQCRKIVFAGLDLAYTDAHNHASGTADVRGQAMGNMLVKDINGNDIPTAKNLNLYQKWIERRIQKEDASGIEFIDATQGGARIQGTIIKNLRDVIAES